MRFHALASYHDLWAVEQSFRLSKTDLRARPMFARTRDVIKAHLTIVFTALAVSCEVQNRTGLAIRNVIGQLRPLRSATVAISGAQQTFPPTAPEGRQAILDALTTRESRTKRAFHNRASRRRLRGAPWCAKIPVLIGCRAGLPAG